jgi:aurora kinase
MWSLPDFEVKQRLGSGETADVYLAVHRESGQTVVLKSIYRAKVSFVKLKQEVELHARLLHPHIIRLFGYFCSEQLVYLVLEYAAGGSLKDSLRGGRFKEEQVREYARQVTLGLRHLHSLGVVHRDIKPENLLLTEHNLVKIADFGLASVMPQKTNRRYTICGTLAYAAPELAHSRGYDYSLDLWALGLLIYELLQGEMPYTLLDFEALVLLKPISLPPRWTSKARDLVSRLLSLEPKARPSIGEVLTHPFLQS